MAGATIVFCDLVGFSQHNNERQKNLIYSLNAEVTHELYAHFSKPDSIPSVIGLPAGDGMAIALLDEPHESHSWASALFSLIDRLMHWAAQNGRIRIGVHTGPVSLIADINRRPNVCGATINIAQRIMDAAHPNQVLFSDTAYRQYVGPHHGRYVERPFSETNPARFTGIYNIIGKPDVTIPVRIMYREDDTTWTVTEPYPRGTIVGSVTRAQFIEHQLDRLLKSKQPQLAIFEQSAFSTFGISEHQEVWRAGPEYTDEYYRASLRQRQLFDRLVREERTTLKLIIYPVRNYDQARMRARFGALLAWMNDPAIKSNERIDFVLGRYEGPNRLIVAGDFCLEGFKLHDTSQYELSIVHNDEQRIAEAISTFDRVFTQAKSEWRTRQLVIKKLEALRLSYTSKSAGSNVQGDRKARARKKPPSLR
jgi:Adenylate and Guanylate cyclase catalytic domain